MKYQIIIDPLSVIKLKMVLFFTQQSVGNECTDWRRKKSIFKLVYSLEYCAGFMAKDRRNMWVSENLGRRHNHTLFLRKVSCKFWLQISPKCYFFNVWCLNTKYLKHLPSVVGDGHPPGIMYDENELYIFSMPFAKYNCCDTRLDCKIVWRAKVIILID